MNDQQIPEPRTLAKKPLVEAIFEFRWRLQDPGRGLPPVDPGFRIALGRYWDRVRSDYPVVEDLPTAQVPEDMTAYTVRHRFRAGKDQWPLTQLGPGILTVNETEGYTWQSFRPRLLSAINAIYAAYPADIAPFQAIGVQLRYVDAVPLPEESTDPTRFLSELLHTSITIDPRLFDDPGKPDAPRDLDLSLRFPLQKPPGTGRLRFRTGARDSHPCIIMETAIRSVEDCVPLSKDRFPAWLDDAHKIAVDKWFFTLIRGELLKTFENSDENANAY